MEKVTGTDPTIEVFENDIELFLNEYKKQEHIEDYKQVGQSIWNSALRYIYINVFKPNKDILKSNSRIITSENNIPSNYNAYNYELLNDICDYYIYNMCMRYNKEVSILGFTTLIGIDQSVIYDWGNNSTKLSSSSANIYKKLNYFREESLSNKLADGKQNPVGVIAILNKHYGWNMPGVSRETTSKQQMSLEDIKGKLAELSQNSAQLPDSNQ